MGPEVEYFPNVSAICGTLQLNAIISVPGSECQLTGHDRATNSRLTGGATVPRPPGKSLWLGRELDRLWVQWAGTTGLCGDTQRASEGSCAFRVCLQVCTCSHVSGPAHLLIVAVCECAHAQTSWERVHRAQVEIRVWLCVHLFHLHVPP